MTNPQRTAPKRPHGLIAHGDTRIDPWFWLRDIDDSETWEYLKAENAYTDAFMAPEAELIEGLFGEMQDQIQIDTMNQMGELREFSGSGIAIPRDFFNGSWHSPLAPFL